LTKFDNFGITWVKFSKTLRKLDHFGMTLEKLENLAIICHNSEKKWHNFTKFHNFDITLHNSITLAKLGHFLTILTKLYNFGTTLA
jgi:hypothetical protein